MRMINEPTAAALAYGLDNQAEQEERILVFDLGGGTFDITVLEMKEKFFDAMAIYGDTQLGGEDFTQRILDDCIMCLNREGRYLDGLPASF